MPPLRQIPESIRSLSDQELADQLIAHNVLLGPILPSTRRVYEIKLYELQTGEKPAPASPYPPVDEDDDKDTDQEVSFKQQPRQRTTKITQREVDNSTITQPSPRRPLHPETGGAHKISSSSTAGVRKSTPEKSSGGISVWLKILCIIIIAVLVFLVIKNMETDPGSSIPTVDL